MADTEQHRARSASARTSPEAVPEAAPEAVPETVPEEVARLAAARGLGELVDVRRGVSATRAVTVGWGTATVSLVLTLALGFETSRTPAFSLAHSLLHALTLAFLFTAVGGIGYGVRGLVAGTRTHYLYADGIVHATRSGPQAVAWPEVTWLKSVHQRGDQSTVGRVVGYRLEAGDGTSFLIPLVLVDGRNAFVDKVVAAMRQHDRPIV
ncbi:hypothetical protein [Kitasatospora sp. GP82]|uniref:hypothetical protein n=1 Tax=Kitasatospora sp. GP82 TaxID=3035089 RepID=UPI0024770AD9|nr:hypothetical protein [Kitasatospora sp. GP82]MDH6128234.1 hypothetical protein [Kitasatospora sp. GP82]